jgi:WD40 repeat protein
VSGPSKQHPGGTLSVAFMVSGSMDTFAVSPNGKWIAGSDWNKVHAWDSMMGQCMATLEEHTSHVTSVMFSPDSRQILLTSDKTISALRESFGWAVYPCSIKGVSLERSSTLVNFTGNPRVLLAVPVPVPAETHTLWHRYGYLGGLPFSDPGYTRTHTRGGNPRVCPN